MQSIEVSLLAKFEDETQTYIDSCVVSITLYIISFSHLLKSAYA